MKKTRILSVAALLALLCVSGASWAQNTLTVYDGTETNNRVPAYTFYWDDFSRSQFVIPAGDLSAMTGGTISALTFYTTDQNMPYTSVSEADVYLKEVSGTTLNSFVDKSSATVVYSGTVEFVADDDGGTMTITFSTPYIYMGGNLLIGIENTTDAGYMSIYFYGQNVPDASGAGHNASSLSEVTFSQENFIPKTTFTYSGGGSSIVTIGGVSAASNRVPTSCFYNNSVSQFIYTASEIGGGGFINSISFLHSDDPDQGSGNEAIDRSFQVYFTHTSQSNYNSNSWVPVDGSDLVASSGVTLPGITGSSLLTIALDAPFYYNGYDNLAVTVVDNNTEFENNHYFMGDNTGSAARSLYKISDETTYSISDLPSSPTEITFRPQVTLNINTFPSWSFGDDMAYCDVNTESPETISYGGGHNMTWAVKYPSSMMTGRNFLKTVRVFMTYGDYTLTVYQGGDDAPQNQIFTQTYTFTGDDGWYSLNIPNTIQLDPTKNLWIVMVSEYAAYGASVGEPNSQLYYEYGDEKWYWVYQIAPYYDGAWLLYAVTSATQPAPTAPVVNISGPLFGEPGQALTFTANGSPDAAFSWTLAGATPATATGTSVTASWSTQGTYDVICTATRSGLSAADTFQVSITDCSIPLSLPFTCGFEPSDNLVCWTFIDADGDGYGWGQSSRNHSGEYSFGSNSWYVEALTPDNWMITPQLHIPAEDATIEWWDYGAHYTDFAEHYSVLVSTTGTETSDFTDNLFETTLAEGHTWTRRTASLASYAGQDIYIAFRHFDCTDQNDLDIDDISITSPSAISINDDPTAFALFPNPATSSVTVGLAESAQVTLLDLSGREVFHAQLPAGQYSIDLSGISAGTYFAHLTNANGTAVRKLVVR